MEDIKNHTIQEDISLEGICTELPRNKLCIPIESKIDLKYAQEFALLNVLRTFYDLIVRRVILITQYKKKSFHLQGKHGNYYKEA